MSQAPTFPKTTHQKAKLPQWWKEFLVVLGFYVMYSIVRNVTGAHVGKEDPALRNALDLINLQEWLHINHELAIQEAFLGTHWLIWLSNVFYSTAHFVVTIAALVWMFFKVPDHYRFWRNTLAATTALALVGYILFPLLPPRLMPDTFGYTDTLKTVGGLWSFESGAVQNVSNQHAAMPSLHFAWALWVLSALLPVTRHWWRRAALVLYPFLTLFAIVVTGNHFILDALGGAFVYAAGWALARSFTIMRRNRVPLPPDETKSLSVPIANVRQPFIDA